MVLQNAAARLITGTRRCDHITPVQFIHPPAAGGGTPEIIAFLNGIIVHGSLSLKNLVVKFTANVFAVSSGLPAAIQAPIITYGSVTVDRPTDRPPVTNHTTNTHTHTKPCTDIVLDCSVS